MTRRVSFLPQLVPALSLLVLLAACARLGTPQAGPTLSPTPTPAASPGPCDPAALQLQFVNWDSNGVLAPHFALYNFAFKNSGTTGCTLAGYPSVDAIPPSGQPGSFPSTVQNSSGLASLYPPESTGPVTLAPGGVAGFYVVVGLSPYDTPDCMAPFPTFQASPPGASRRGVLVIPRSSIVTCTADSIYVSPVHPDDALPTPPL